MLRRLIPALALALVPLTAASPPAGAAAGPIVVGPGVYTVKVEFTLAEPADDVVLIVVDAAGNVIDQRTLPDPAAGTAHWDSYDEPDGTYWLRLLVDGEPAPDVLDQEVRVNVNPPTVTAPTLSAGTFFPVRDGYRDTVTVRHRAPVSETGLRRARVEVLNRAGHVVWHSSARRATWNGRAAGGRKLPAGAYRVRTVAIDTDGLRAVSRARVLRLSPKKLMRHRDAAVIKAEKYMLARTWTGPCGRVITPARRGKAWRGSVSLSSNHRCKARGTRSAVETHYAARYPHAKVYQSLRIQVHGRGHSARSDRALAFTIRKDGRNDSGVANVRRLRSKQEWRTIANLRGPALRRHTIGSGFIWGAITFDGARYDVRRFRMVAVYEVLADPSKVRNRARTVHAGGSPVPARVPAANPGRAGSALSR